MNILVHASKIRDNNYDGIISAIIGSLIWSKILIELIFLTPVVTFREIRMAQLAKFTLLLTTLGLLEYFLVF